VFQVIKADASAELKAERAAEPTPARARPARLQERARELNAHRAAAPPRAALSWRPFSLLNRV
jgi:hypothetical protein